MPVTVSYPGVYIEEIPSGVRTITGVATSITAFIGRALRGPTDQAVTINSYSDFERTFGGLWSGSTLGYAVRDFYLNGGSQAIIVRLFHPTFATPADQAQAVKDATAAAQAVATAANTEAGVAGAKAADVATAARAAANGLKTPTAAQQAAANQVATAAETAAAAPGATNATVAKAATDAQAAAIAAAAPVTRALLHANGLELESANEGAWGNRLRARIDLNVVGPDAANLFNLLIRDDGTGLVEVFRNVSVVSEHPRQVDKVLADQSNLVQLNGALPASRPTAHPDPAAGLDIWSDNKANTQADPVDPASDGSLLDINDFIDTGMAANKQGLFRLEEADLFNLLCIPPYLASDDVDPNLITAAAAYCEQRRAMFLVDPPSTWESKDAARTGVANIGTNSKNAALFFPRIQEFDPLNDNRLEELVPCGAVAGIFARTDTQRGVWKAPAGLDATLVGVPQLSVNLTDAENGELNPLGVNCLRSLPGAGRVVWGSRTLQGDDRLASEWKYVPVRRLALYLEESLYRGTQWVVFEPNDTPLWAQIRLNVGAFMQDLFRQGAFQGRTAREAYFVKCDGETTTQNDINAGKVNIVVGFAPLKPAEFVILQIQQMAGQIVT